MCLGTKILKIGPKLRELWPCQSKYPELPIEITITHPHSGVNQLWDDVCIEYFERFWLSRPVEYFERFWLSRPRPKFWCLNIIAFQDLSFSFTDQPRGTCPRGQKRVLKLVHENKNDKIWKKWSSRSHSTDFFLQVNWKVFRWLKFEIWGLSDFAEKSYECLFV